MSYNKRVWENRLSEEKSIFIHLFLFEYSFSFSIIQMLRKNPAKFYAFHLNPWVMHLSLQYTWRSSFIWLFTRSPFRKLESWTRSFKIGFSLPAYCKNLCKNKSFKDFLDHNHGYLIFLRDFKPVRSYWRSVQEFYTIVKKMLTKIKLVGLVSFWFQWIHRLL